MTNRKAIDWERIEREYRAGQLSIREIAKQHDISDGSIRKRAKRDNWTRDLTARVHARTKEELLRTEARIPVRISNASDDEIIQEAAARAVEVVRSHRKVIKSGRNLVERMLDELNTTTSHVGEMEEMISDESPDKADAKKRNAMLRAVSLPGRATVMRDLATSMKNLIYIERQAFNISDGSSETKPDEPEPTIDASKLSTDTLAELVMAASKNEDNKR